MLYIVLLCKQSIRVNPASYKYAVRLHAFSWNREEEEEEYVVRTTCITVLCCIRASMLYLVLRPRTFDTIATLIVKTTAISTV